MKISSIQENNKPNFHAIKSIKCRGLYEIYPRQAKSLVEAFKENDVAMNFCREHDVDILLNAKKKSAGILSSFKMSFLDPTKSKFLGIFGSNKSSILISGSSRAEEWEILTDETILERATKNIINDVSGQGFFQDSLSSKIENLQSNLHKDLEETIKATINQTKRTFYDL